jgi:hypothetical protein
MPNVLTLYISGPNHKSSPMLFSFRKPRGSRVEPAWPLVVLIWWLAFLALILLTYGSYIGNDLAAHAKITEASITGFRPEIHNSVVIEYVVSGITYTTLTNALGDDERASRKVRVYYDTRDPRNFSTRNPLTTTKQMVTEVFRIIIIGAFLTVFVISYSALRRSKPNLPPLLPKFRGKQ